MRHVGRSARHRFLSDFRYATQSAEQVPDAFEREIVAGDLLEALAAALARGPRGGRLGFDEASLTVKGAPAADGAAGAGVGARSLRGRRGAAARGQGRRRRSPASAPRASWPTRRCARSSKTAWWAAPSARWRSSSSCACAASARRRRASRRSWPPAPTARSRTREPREQEIPPDVLVTIDWGALHEGYCSDCTRTYATGEGISAQAREIYELVLERPGAGAGAPSGRDPAAARWTRSHAR